MKFYRYTLKGTWRSRNPFWVAVGCSHTKWLVCKKPLKLWYQSLNGEWVAYQNCGFGCMRPSNGNDGGIVSYQDLLQVLEGKRWTKEPVSEEDGFIAIL